MSEKWYPVHAEYKMTDNLKRLIVGVLVILFFSYLSLNYFKDFLYPNLLLLIVIIGVIALILAFYIYNRYLPNWGAKGNFDVSVARGYIFFRVKDEWIDDCIPRYKERIDDLTLRVDDGMMNLGFIIIMIFKNKDDADTVESQLNEIC